MNKRVFAPLGAMLTISSASFEREVMSWRKEETSPLPQASQRAAWMSNRAFSFASENIIQLSLSIPTKFVRNTVACKILGQYLFWSVSYASRSY